MFRNTIVFVQHRFAISHRPARFPPSGKPRSHRATAQSQPDPAAVPRESPSNRAGSRETPLRQPKLPKPDPVSCGSYLRKPKLPSRIPRNPFTSAQASKAGFCIPRQLFAAALHARRGFPAPRPRQNPLDEPACPPARTFANIANIIRMHERVLSDEKRRAKLSASDERGPCRGVS